MLFSGRIIRGSIIVLFGLLFLSPRSIYSQTHQEMLQQAHSLFEREEFERALQVYDQILNASPDFYPSRIGKAKCLSNLQRRAEANEILDQVLEQSPTDSEALITKGKNLALTGNHTEAKSIFEKYTELYPEDIIGWYNLATTQRELNQTDSALKYFRKVTQLISTNGQTIPDEMKSLLPYQLGLIYLSKNKLEQAIAYFQQAIQAAPWRENPRYQLAMALARDKRSKESKQWMESFQKIKEVQKKIRYLQTVSEKASQDATPHIAIGQLYFAIGNLHQAELSVLRALDNNPNDPNALNYLGLIYIHQKRFDEARTYLQNAAENDPNAPQAFMNLGTLELQLGNFQKAKDYYRQALTVQPGFQPAEKGLIRLKQLEKEK